MGGRTELIGNTGSGDLAQVTGGIGVQEESSRWFRTGSSVPQFHHVATSQRHPPFPIASGCPPVHDGVATENHTGVPTSCGAMLSFARSSRLLVFGDYELVEAVERLAINASSSALSRGRISS